ncbi:MAG: right-handed parallel beta-helix repeat-containing protein, partial [Acidobacteria bacterium]|nr:right-handed parallel beta-helix repeat-containing protein [Acidobacteriota bacterium]
DTDGDLVFGTITAALGAANGAANQNGRITIVTSGRFAEALFLTSANGNTSIEAAPGVEAIIDAVITGARATEFAGDTNANRQAQSGIVVNSTNLRQVVLRNLVVRNWLNGIVVIGDSRVTIDKCRLEGNVNLGIFAQDTARVAIQDTHVVGTGYRVGSTGQAPADGAGSTAGQTVLTPNPGDGVRFIGSASGVIANSSVLHNFGAGVSGVSTLQQINVVQFGNATPSTPTGSGPCPAGQPATPSPGSAFVPTQDCQGWVPAGHPNARS